MVNSQLQSTGSNYLDHSHGKTSREGSLHTAQFALLAMALDGEQKIHAASFYLPTLL
jgi:hypothetical protein